MQLAIDITRPPYKPEAPAILNRAGNRLWGMYTICVNADGTVKSVKQIKGTDPLFDPEILAKIKTWRYKPYTVDGRPQPFCYNLRFNWTSQGV
jgi:outer membrane biosynthesis protein TonB